MNLFEDTYLTIAGPSQGLFKDRGSKFMAYAFPVKSEEEVKTHLRDLKKEHHSARHHCYAFRLGADKQFFRTNDDGDPSGTAGRPILGQIQSKDLTDILIIVVRYFGGTLLGTGGLVQAYKASAADALAQASIVTHTVMDEYEVHFPYTVMNEVMQVIKDNGLSHRNQHFETSCSLNLLVRKQESERTEHMLKRIEGVHLQYKGTA
jgi:uncharacterized YigZ family protein